MNLIFCDRKDKYLKILIVTSLPPNLGFTPLKSDCALHEKVQEAKLEIPNKIKIKQLFMQFLIITKLSREEVYKDTLIHLLF